MTPAQRADLQKFVDEYGPEEGVRRYYRASSIGREGVLNAPRPQIANVIRPGRAGLVGKGGRPRKTPSGVRERTLLDQGSRRGKETRPIDEAFRRPGRRQNVTAGISIQKDAPPAADAETATAKRLHEEISGLEGADFVKVLPTYGIYFETERSFDVEAVVRKKSFDYDGFKRSSIKVAQENDQDSAFASRKLASADDSPNARPGVEVQFTRPLPLAEAEAILNKAKAAGLLGATLRVDSSIRPGAKVAPTDAVYIGLSAQWIPEFTLRYDGPDNPDVKPFLDGDEDGMRMALDRARSGMDDAALAVEGDPNVAFADVAWFDTDVFYNETYEADVASLGRDGASADRGDRVRGRQVSGLSLRERLARAVEQSSAEQSGGRSAPDDDGDLRLNVQASRRSSEARAGGLERDLELTGTRPLTERPRSQCDRGLSRMAASRAPREIPEELRGEASLGALERILDDVKRLEDRGLTAPGKPYR